MRETISRGAIYKVPARYADMASLNVTFNRETITVNGTVFSGYSLSECLCKSLINEGIVSEWEDAVAIVEEMGVPYVTDEDVCAQCGEDAAEYYTRDDDESTRICGKCYGN